MKIKIAIIGLGYVGLPIALAASKKYRTLGFDINSERILSLKKDVDINGEINKQQLRKSKINFTNDIQKLISCNFYIITVPTPVKKNNEPDLEPLKKAVNILVKVIKKGDVFVLESTVYPGLTREIIIKEIEKRKKFKLNIDFYAGYSPERINPGDKLNKFENINKVVSGSNTFSKKIIHEVYKNIISAKVYQANSIEEAEASKIIENIQRDVNISLINELSQIFKKIGIDTKEVLRLSSTKWNFLKFRPGLVGGHCVSIDPYYLLNLCKKKKIRSNIIKSSRALNENMFKFIASDILAKLKKLRCGNKLLIFGATFKENCNDIRNSGALKLAKYLQNKKIKIDIFDPNVKCKLNFNHISEFSNIKEKYDCIIVAVYHQNFKKFLTKDKLTKILKSRKVIYDLTHQLDNNINHFRI